MMPGATMSAYDLYPNPAMKRLLKHFKRVMHDPHTPPHMRDYYEQLHGLAEDARLTYEQLLGRLHMDAYRHPDFPGDYVGRPDDDFDDDEPDDDDNAKPDNAGQRD